MRPSIECVSDSFVTVLANMRDDSELVGYGTGKVVDELSETNAVPEKMEEVPGVTVSSDACERLNDQLNDTSFHNIKDPQTDNIASLSLQFLWSPNARPHHSYMKLPFLEFESLDTSMLSIEENSFDSALEFFDMKTVDIMSDFDKDLFAHNL